MSILDRDSQHLFLEKQDNTGNSFIANVNILAGQFDDILIVSHNIDSVNSVADHIDAIEVLEEHLSNIDIVSENIYSVNTVSHNINNVVTVSQNIEKVEILTDNIEHIVTVTNEIHKINKINDNWDTINKFQDYIEDSKIVIEKIEYNTNIASQQANIANEQANIATNKANEASTSASNAKDSEVKAKNSENNSKISENNAKDSEVSSKNSATNAAISATNANNSALLANNKASESTISANNAKTSEINAKDSEINAKDSAISASDNALQTSNDKNFIKNAVSDIRQFIYNTVAETFLNELIVGVSKAATEFGKTYLANRIEELRLFETEQFSSIAEVNVNQSVKMLDLQVKFKKKIKKLEDELKEVNSYLTKTFATIADTDIQQSIKFVQVHKRIEDINENIELVKSEEKEKLNSFNWNNCIQACWDAETNISQSIRILKNFINCKKSNTSNIDTEKLESEVKILKENVATLVDAINNVINGSVITDENGKIISITIDNINPNDDVITDLGIIDSWYG